MRSALLLVPLSLFLALAAQPERAEACGGCFSPPETVTSVDAHRMVVSLSPNRSILWDQIRYTGAPEDFVWVLPVPSTDPIIDVADELFFAELEAYTAPQVFGPPPPTRDCPPLDCDDCPVAGASDAAASGGVDVYREDVVGPYETVVIGSDDPGALAAWLNEHGYNIPESTVPVLQHYIDQKMKFVALRLSPKQGVSAMQPIRVEYAGYMATFPLKMVTVGAYNSLQLTLWVIAEQRYHPLNYADAVVADSDLVWDFATGTSNYRDLMRAAIDGAGGRAWVTQLAQPLSSFYWQSTEVQIVNTDIEYPFLTRLATDMLVDHLDQDLQLGPLDAEWVSNVLFASQYVNPPEPPPCPTTCLCGPSPGDQGDDEEGPVDRVQSCVGCGTAGAAGTGLWVVAVTIGFPILCRLRRRRRSAPRRS